MAKAKPKTTTGSIDSVTQSGSTSEGGSGADLGRNAPVTALYVQNKWNAGRISITRDVLNFWINWAFWMGSQWLHLPKGFSSESLIEPVFTSERVRRTKATINKVRPGVQNLIQRSTKAPLAFDVMAAAADDFTHSGAIKGEGLLREKSQDDGWDELREELAEATALGGTAAIATDWDASAHRYNSEIATGDAVLSVLSIEDFVVEPGALKAKTARWWIRKQVLPPEQVQADYKLDHLPPVDDVAGGPFSEKAFAISNILSARRGTRVLTYYERPNWLRPAGAVAVVINNKVVFSGAWPFPFKDHLNLEVARAIIIPGRWAGDTFVTDAISPQRQYNQLWTKIHEVTHRTAGTKMMLDQRHADLNKNIDDDPEIPMVLSAADGAKQPGYLSPPQLPSQSVQQLEALETAIQDALGSHSISQGETPTNAPDSGYGLQILSENDSTPAGRLAKELARVFSGAASNVLALYADQVSDTRTTAVNSGKSVRVMKWSGKDLAGQTRAIVPADSVLPHSPAGILKMAVDLAGTHPNWFPTLTGWLRFASVPGFENMVEASDPDTAKADWENGRMAEGEQGLVDMVDNDAVHIHEHENFMKTPEFILLDKKSQQLFRLHVDAHHAAESHKQGIASAMQAASPMLGATTLGRGIPGAPPMPGAPPLPGGPPGPPQPEAGPSMPPMQ